MPRPTAGRRRSSDLQDPATLTEIHDKLLEQHGPQHWWPADSPFEVMVGAVLVQATAWSNAEKAIDNLKAADSMSPRAIRRLTMNDLETLVRSSGFYKAKARKLMVLCEYLGDRHADDIEAMAAQSTELLREEFLGIYGIGPETADDILLYALGHPVFVVDAYTRRLLHRLGLTNAKASYHDLQALFHERLPRRDAGIYNEYHALIVRHSNSICKPRPQCAECSLESLCPKFGV